MRQLGSAPETSSPESPLPRRPCDASIGALRGTTASPSHLTAASPTSPRSTCALAARRRSAPGRSAPAPRGLPSFTWEETLGSSPAYTAASAAPAAGRSNQCPRRYASDTRAPALDGCLEPPRAKGLSPFRPPHRPPLQAPLHTSNQQRRRVRRAEVSGRGAEDQLQRILLARRPRPPTNVKPRKPGSRELVPSLPALPRRQALRLATRNTDVPPPLPPPPLIVLPLPTGLGNPPARPQPITHLLREPDPTFSRPSAEHAQTIAALTYSRARKAGEPEPA